MQCTGVNAKIHSVCVCVCVRARVCVTPTRASFWISDCPSRKEIATNTFAIIATSTTVNKLSTERNP